MEGKDDTITSYFCMFGGHSERQTIVVMAVFYFLLSSSPSGPFLSSPACSATVSPVLLDFHVLERIYSSFITFLSQGKSPGEVVFVSRVY